MNKLMCENYFNKSLKLPMILTAVFLLSLSSIAFELLLIRVFSISQWNHLSFMVISIALFGFAAAGFMFVKLFFIKKYIFIFGDPVISFTVVLTEILIFSGFGGYCSQRIGPGGLRYVLIALIAAPIFIFLGLDPMIHRILGFSKILQYTLATLLLILPGFIVSLPFPLGMRFLLNCPAHRAYTWTANGFALVLTSILSAQIAISLGIPIIILCAVASYFVAFFMSHNKTIGQKQKSLIKIVKTTNYRPRHSA